MPWNETCPMRERLRFVTFVEQGEETMAELCRQFGISRKTGYAILARYAAEGVEGLRDRSHAAHVHPNAVSEEIERRILDLRRIRPTWGPIKLRGRLEKIDPTTQWPAKSTFGDILRRHGLVAPRRRRKRTPAHPGPFAACNCANDTWAIDFKGWFRTGDGRRCDPLTISDVCSRYLLRCQAVQRADGDCVRPLLEATFREYGLPRTIRSDNGPPFASRGVGGLSSLSVWWIKLGITPERITPGRPSENGRHERFHGTLASDTCDPPALTWRAQQRRFDAFRRIYNEERPHQALGNATPMSVYQPSPRPYPSRLAEIVYPEDWQVRVVRHSGEIKWRGEQLFIGEALAGEPVGIEEAEGDHWRVHYASVLLGTINRAGQFEKGGVKRHRRGECLPGSTR